VVWHEDLRGDWIRGTSQLVTHGRIHLDDTVSETVDDWRIGQDSPWHRSVLLEALGGWSLAGFFPWQDVDQDTAEEEHDSMVVERL